MWQLYILIALVFTCLEDVVEKKIITNSIDSDVASFVRVFLYCAMAIPVIIFMHEKQQWYFDIWIIAFGFGGAYVSKAYTVLLKEVEISFIAILAYLSPIIFLGVDSFIGNSFTDQQMLAIAGLVIGGVVFSFSSKFHLNRRIVLTLLLSLVYSGMELYYMKHLNKEKDLSAISFFVNVWCIALGFLALEIAIKKKMKLLLLPEMKKYTKASSVTKLFDIAATVFSGKALMLTTVSQFSSMEVFFPVIMVVVIWITQNLLKIDIGENFDRTHLLRKTIACMIIVVSGLYIH